MFVLCWNDFSGFLEKLLIPLDDTQIFDALQGVSQEGKIFWVLHESGNKTQLGV